MVFLVVRSPYDGPLGKRIVRLDAPSVLAWFQRAWGESLSAEPGSYVSDTLGGRVYGLASLFAAIRTHRLPPPQSMPELSALLREHLYVEGELRTSAASVRVLTDDDEVGLAYFFFDAALAAANPERFAWLLHADQTLPGGVSDRSWSPPALPITALEPPGRGAGATYAVLLTCAEGSHSVQPAGPFCFSGLRLPELAAHLCAGDGAGWPPELRLLRALLHADAPSLEAGLRGVIASAFGAFLGRAPRDLGVGPHAEATREVAAFMAPLPQPARPEESRLHVQAHCAQLLLHVHPVFGHQQWVLFDDRWAAANPALAASLLWSNHSWDPLEGTDSVAPRLCVGAPGPSRHPLHGIGLPDGTQGSAAEVLAVAQGFAEMRCQQVYTMQAAARNIAQSPWAEGALRLRGPVPSVQATDVLRALLALHGDRIENRELGERFSAARARSVRAMSSLPRGRRTLPLSMALRRRWALSGGAPTVDGLLSAVSPELIFALAPMMSQYQEGLITAPESLARVASLLPVAPSAAVPAAYVDWSGGLSAISQVPAGQPLWVVGSEGSGRRALLSAGGREGLTRTFGAWAEALKEAAGAAQSPAWIEIPRPAPPDRLRVLVAHHPVVEDLWRRPWGLCDTLALLSVLPRAADDWSLAELLTALHAYVGALARLPGGLVRLRGVSPRSLWEAHPEAAAVGRGLAQQPAAVIGRSRRWRRWLFPPSGRIDLRHLARREELPDVAAVRQVIREEAEIMDPGAGAVGYTPR